MKALPLWQPWASLVAIGAKRVETRGYPPSRLGLEARHRIAIYATKGGMSQAEDFEWLRRHARAAAQLAEHVDVQTRPDWVREALPRGAIVCTCVLDRATRVTPTSSEQLRQRNPGEYSYGDYDVAGARERWAWVLRDVELFDPPVPATTHQQGAFDWHPDGQPVEVAQGSLL